MQLDEFISETLKAIIKGTKDSQEFAKENRAVVNPQIIGPSGGTKYIRMDRDENNSIISDIDFDVAVTASSKQESGIGGGINVLSINLRGKKEETDLHQTVSRIKFTITVALPSSLPYTPLQR
jgi:hypothetical protein